MGRFRNPWIDPRVERVRPDQIEAYLLHHGWKLQPPEYPNAKVFEPPFRLAEKLNPIITVSFALDDPGYVETVCRAIGDIASFEDRYALAVLNEILGESPNGTPTNGGAAATEN